MRTLLFLASGTQVIDERTKKVLLVLCALAIILLLIMGIIYSVISNYMKKESFKMDGYMTDLVKTKIVRNKRQFMAAVNYHETRSFYQNSIIGWWVLILATGALFGFAFIALEGDYNTLFTKIGEIFPIIKWETVAQYNETLKELCEATGRMDEFEAMRLSGPSFLPASVFPSFISKHPDFKDYRLYISIIYYVLAFFGLNVLIKACLGYMGRKNRARKKVKDMQIKSLDGLTFDTVDTLKLDD